MIVYCAISQTYIHQNQVLLVFHLVHLKITRILDHQLMFYIFWHLTTVFQLLEVELIHEIEIGIMGEIILAVKLYDELR